MFLTSLYFIKLTANKTLFNKEDFINEDGKEFWNESASLGFFIDELV